MKQSNPVGQQRAINKTAKSLIIRLNNSERRIKAIMRKIPRKKRTIADIINNLSFTEYDIDAGQRNELAQAIERILNDELLDDPLGQQIIFDWYYKDEIEPPYRTGTATEVNEANRLIDAAIIAGVLAIGVRGFTRKITVEEALLSSEYRILLEEVYVRNYVAVKGLAKRTTTQLVQAINGGFDSRLTITDIAEEIAARFDVADSSARRIAQTEVNRAFNDAKMDAGDLIAKQTGVKTAVRHISALIPTTRPDHAARHQQIFTREAQEQWWNSGINRINCYCSVQTVLLDGKKKPIIL